MSSWQRFNHRLAAVQPQLGTVSCCGLQVRVLRLHDIQADPGQGAPEHAHAWFELSVIHRGAADYSVGACTRRVPAGGVFALPPGVAHRWQPALSGTVVCGYQLQLAPMRPAARPDLEAWCRAQADGRWSAAPHPFAQALVEELHAAVADGLPPDLLALLVRTHLAWTLERLGAGAADPARAAPPPERDERIPQLRDWLLEHLAEEVSLAELAHRIGVTPRHLNRLFRREVGLPVHRFVIEQRLLRAHDALAWNDVPVTEVAHALGFHDMPHFTRVFKARFGASPAHWRSEVQAGR